MKTMLQILGAVAIFSVLFFATQVLIVYLLVDQAVRKAIP